MNGRKELLALLCLSFALVQAYVTIVKKYPDKPDAREYAKHCQELAVGVSLCNEIDIDGKDLEIIVKHIHTPSNCNMQVQKGYFVRLHYTIHIDDSSKVGTPGELIEESKDFTRGQTIRIGLDSAPVKAWDMVMLNMCLGQKISMVVPPEVGYKEPKAGVPEGATLFFEIEIMIIMEANKQTGKPMPPNLFKLMDSDGSRDLDEREIHYHFDRIGQKLPSPTLFKDQDKDSDGKISWDEFSGPKGTKDEL